MRPVVRVALAAFALVATLVGGGLVVEGLQGSDRAGSALRVSPEVPLTPMDLGVRAAHNSPVLALDPTEPRFVVVANRLDAPDFGCALQVSGDRGRGWTPVNPVPKLPAGADKCYAPEVAFDDEGVLYYLFVGLAGRGNEPMGAFLVTSKDRAQTFSVPRRVLGPRNFAVRMAVDASIGDRGRIHLVWLHATSDPPLGGFGPPPNPIMAAYSDDGGRTFSAPVQVSDPARRRVVAPTLALGPDHLVHVAYYDLQDDAIDYQGLEGPTWDRTWSVVVASSKDGGRRFAPGVVVDDEIVPNVRVMLIFTMPPPALAAAASGALCAAWPDARRGDADVVVRCTRDGVSKLWGPLRRANDDRVGNGVRQYLPRLSFSSGGRLDLVFFDQRGDPEGHFANVSYTYSRDEGRRFARNLTLTDDPSDTRIGQQYVNVSATGQVEFGSRLALLSLPEGALVAWPDTRNSRAGITAQDLFATEVEVTDPDGDGTDGRQVGAGIGILLSGVVVVLFAAPRRGRPSGGARGGPEA